MLIFYHKKGTVNVHAYFLIFIKYVITLQYLDSYILLYYNTVHCTHI